MASEVTEGKYHKNPYPKFKEHEQSAIFNFKDNDKIVVSESLQNKIQATIGKLVKVMDKNFEKTDGFRNYDYSVYVGTSGQAMFYYFYYLKTQNPKYLEKAEKLIEKSLKQRKKRRFSFLNGDAGPLAISAVIYETQGKHTQVKESVDKLKALLPYVIDPSSEIPDEILYGRAGYLYSLLFINKHLKSIHMEPEVIKQVVASIIKSGRTLSEDTSSRIPLVYEWHEKNYYGAAHGVAGILFTLLKANSFLTPEEREKLVRPTLDALLEERFQSGNLRSSQGSNSDRLVQWCHGSPGLLSLLQVAYEVFKDRKYLDASVKAADNIWSNGLLRKGYSLCHGVAGNGYAFLSAYHTTHNNEYIYRALCFADWCTLHNKHEDQPPDRPYSLYEGIAGVIFFLLDILNPTNAKFPGYEDI